MTKQVHRYGMGSLCLKHTSSDLGPEVGAVQTLTSSRLSHLFNRCEKQGRGGGEKKGPVGEETQEGHHVEYFDFSTDIGPKQTDLIQIFVYMNVLTDLMVWHYAAKCVDG